MLENYEESDGSCSDDEDEKDIRELLTQIYMEDMYDKVRQSGFTYKQLLKTEKDQLADIFSSKERADKVYKQCQLHKTRKVWYD